MADVFVIVLNMKGKSDVLIMLLHKGLPYKPKYVDMMIFLIKNLKYKKTFETLDNFLHILHILAKLDPSSQVIRYI